MTHRVRIPWNNQRDWNRICIWAVEQFGLPGDRYMTHASSEHMDFDFVAAQDAEFFALKWR
jgi:hypothetical protein